MRKRNSMYDIKYILAYLVDQLKKQNSDTIGRTKIQKLIFLFSLKRDIDLNYSLYHYGPFSSYVSSELDVAQNMNLLISEYSPLSGYSIKTNKACEVNTEQLSKDDIKIINNIIENYGDYSVNQLAIIATALYIKKNFGIKDDNELINSLHEIKSDFGIEYIRKILIENKILKE
jgi:uncharacterized protein YwgA